MVASIRKGKITKASKASKAIKTKSSKSKMETERKQKQEQKRLESLKRKITRKDIRKYEIQRVSGVLRILPKFVKFYNKLSDAQIRAIKYYLGPGSFWQTMMLTSTIKNREISVPFIFNEESSLRRDIMGDNAVQLLPLTKSIDIKDLDTYIKNSITTRVKLLNRLEEVYNRLDCPKLTGNEILFRGIGMFPELKKCKVGDKIKFKNFMSSSLDRKIAEMYSGGDTLLIMTGLKDVPFIYMPNSKEYGNQKFGAFAANMEINWDLSEFTLPRNLEFKVDAIDEDIITHTYYSNKPVSFKKLTSILTKKGLLESTKKNTKTKKTTNGDKTENKPSNNVVPQSPETSLAQPIEPEQDELSEQQIDEKRQIIEKSLFGKIKVYYLSFVQRHKEPPITYEQITENAKFVIDKFALNSWKNNPSNMFRPIGIIP
jgi:hypothetical protein